MAELYDIAGGGEIISRQRQGFEPPLDVECGGAKLELRPVEWERQRANFKSGDVYVARMWVEMLDLHSGGASVPMRAFIEKYGSRPLAVARVTTIEGSSGVTELWVKVRDNWLLVRHLSSLIS